MFTMVALQVVPHVSHCGCYFLLLILRYIIQLSMIHNKCNISTHNEEFVGNIPADPDHISNKFALDGKERIYAVCLNVKCHKAYPSAFHKDSPIPVYPKYCTYKEFPRGPDCRTCLTCHRAFANVNIKICNGKDVSHCIFENHKHEEAILPSGLYQGYWRLRQANRWYRHSCFLWHCLVMQLEPHPHQGVAYGPVLFKTTIFPLSFIFDTARWNSVLCSHADLKYCPTIHPSTFSA